MAATGSGLPVPSELQRSAHKDRGEWIESGRFATRLLAETIGRADLAGVSVLDVGCGTKIVKTILDDQLPIGRYVGIDVAAEVIDWLGANVDDPRFEFAHFPARNELYNPTGPTLSEFDRLPVEGDFDLICLFSVFTHLDPVDYVAMLRLAREHIRPTGRLLFSVFIDEPDDPPSPYAANLAEALESGDPDVHARFAAVLAARENGYREGFPDQPLLQSRYTRAKALELIDATRWDVVSVTPRSEHMQHRIVCRPV